jgi:hypothetical protein
VPDESQRDIEHPEQIELPQLYLAKFWWLACVFEVDGLKFVGSCGCAAALMEVDVVAQANPAKV